SPATAPPHHLHSFPTRRSSDLTPNHPPIHRKTRRLLRPRSCSRGPPLRRDQKELITREFVRPFKGLETVDPLLTIDFRRWSGERSEEHTSELQSRGHLVCRLLL